MAQAGFTQGAAFALLAGIIIAFILERFIVWHHCHTPGDHAHPVGFIVLFGDGIHNFLDGIVIGASYLVSTEVGIATTVAVLLHEIPQELSDFGILIHAGFSRTAALLANLASAAAAILGVILVWYAGSNHAWLVLLVPFAAGNFLYIALADIVPNLHKETRIRAGLLQVVLLLLGVGLMAAMAFLE